MKVTEASGVLREVNKIGKVINISSGMGSVTYTQTQGRFNAPLYRCSKAAQVLMTKNQRDEKTKILQLSEDKAS